MKPVISISLLVLFFICFFTTQFLSLNKQKEKRCTVDLSLSSSNETHFAKISSALDANCDIIILLVNGLSPYIEDGVNPEDFYRGTYNRELIKSTWRHMIWNNYSEVNF